MTPTELQATADRPSVLRAAPPVLYLNDESIKNDPDGDNRILGLDFVGQGLIRANLDGEIINVTTAASISDQPTGRGRHVEICDGDQLPLLDVTVGTVYYRQFALRYDTPSAKQEQPEASVEDDLMVEVSVELNGTMVTPDLIARIMEDDDGSLVEGEIDMKDAYIEMTMREKTETEQVFVSAVDQLRTITS